jgi:hypothetical protein
LIAVDLGSSISILIGFGLIRASLSIPDKRNKESTQGFLGVAGFCLLIAGVLALVLHLVGHFLKASDAF